VIMQTADAELAAQQRDALAERVFNATVDAMDLAAIYLGDQLGYYRGLVQLGDATSAELAAHVGANERYTREWLEQQAVTGILDVRDTGDAATRRYTLPDGHATALLDDDSLSYVMPFAKMLAGINGILPALVEAYLTGGGVPYNQFGAAVRSGIGEGNRVMFNQFLAGEWIPAMPDIHERLTDARRPARVVDIGCGTGWSSIALARGFPAINVVGIDIDAASIAEAVANAAMARVSDRVTFRHGDAATPGLAGRYDLVCAFECLHDMAYPVEALKAMRKLAGPGGTVLIADEHVADQFTAPGDTVERLMYGFSVLHCLTVAMADGAEEGTGTVFRTETLRAYAAEAGFKDVEVLPIEHDLWRFYRLTA
jgi:SAM-dependent methyltransferase